MKTMRRLFLLSFCSLGFVTGCHTSGSTSPLTSSASQAAQNNCYGLLHQLLADEKHIGLLRFFKHEEAGVKDLTKRVAGVSRAGAKQLEKFASLDPSIRLDDISLPPGEVATREAIASTKQKELLAQKGDDFELSLLLTQAEALSYGWHLAKVACELDANPERARAMAALSGDLRGLYYEVIDLMRSRAK